MGNQEDQHLESWTRYLNSVSVIAWALIHWITGRSKVVGLATASITSSRGESPTGVGDCLAVADPWRIKVRLRRIIASIVQHGLGDACYNMRHHMSEPVVVHTGSIQPLEVAQGPDLFLRSVQSSLLSRLRTFTSGCSV